MGWYCKTSALFPHRNPTSISILRSENECVSKYVTIGYVQSYFGYLSILWLLIMIVYSTCLLNLNERLNIMPKPVVDRMVSLYKSAHDFDLYIGDFVEKHFHGFLIGARLLGHHYGSFCPVKGREYSDIFVNWFTLTYLFSSLCILVATGCTFCLVYLCAHQH